jgi:hypothetical protein
MGPARVPRPGRQITLYGTTGWPAARRAFPSNCPITQCDAVCTLADIRPQATAPLHPGRRRSRPALNGGAHVSAACALRSCPFTTPVTRHNSCGRSWRWHHLRLVTETTK